LLPEAQVHAGKHLAGGEETKERAVPQSTAAEEAVKRPERKGETLGLLKLQMRIVINPVWQEGEDNARDDAGGRVVCQ